MIGTVLMAHGDDDGAIIPPRIASSQIVILPVTPKEESKAAVLEACAKLAAELCAQTYAGESIRVELDKRDLPGGTKSWEWIKKGIPVRIEIGPRDLEKGTAAVSRRDMGVKEKTFPPLTELVANMGETLANIQSNLFTKAEAFRNANMQVLESKEAFYDYFKAEDGGGFALAHWNGSAAIEEQIKNDLKVTIRCIPFARDYFTPEPGICIFTGEPSAQRVIFARSY